MKDVIEARRSLNQADNPSERTEKSQQQQLKTAIEVCEQNVTTKGYRRAEKLSIYSSQYTHEDLSESSCERWLVWRPDTTFSSPEKEQSACHYFTLSEWMLSMLLLARTVSVRRRKGMFKNESTAR